MIKVSIDLNKIPEDKIFTPEGSSGRYITVLVSPLRDGANQWGKTHSVKLSSTKEEREAGAEVVYVGSGTEYNWNDQTAASSESGTDSSGNALPF